MPQPTVTALALEGVENHFTHSSIDVIEVAGKLGIQESLWSNLDQDIPLRQFVRLLETLAKMSNDPATLWLAGYNYDFRNLGEVGELLAKSRSLGDALCKFRDFFVLLQTAAHFDLQINDRETRIQYKVLDSQIWPRRGDAEFTLGLIQSTIDHHVGDRNYPISFQLEDYSGTGIALGRKINKHFKGTGLYNEICIPTQLLYSRRSNSSQLENDPTKQLVDKLTRLRSRRKRCTPTAYQVKYAILKKLGQMPVDQTNIADEIGMSRRTLRRKLAEEGCSFQKLLDNSRVQQASLELTRSELSIGEIALKVGFSEQSSFTRVFVKWTRQTPGEFRRKSCIINTPDI